jgi:signal transduction histidine kinase
MDALDLLVGLTARLASTARLDEIVDAVLPEIVKLGFGAVWIAVLDDPSGCCSTLKDVRDGGTMPPEPPEPPELPKLVALDLRQPVFRDHTVINVTDHAMLHVVERDDAAVPPGKLALPRVLHDHLRGHPFACGLLLDSRGEPVGALTLSSYLGAQPVPDAVLSHGFLPSCLHHLGIAMERARHVARIEQLEASLRQAQEALAVDAGIKAVGELAAGAAHDLKNLSGIAVLNVGLGLSSPAAAFEVLPRIERTSRAIGQLVARLQRIAGAPTSKVEVSNLPLIIEDVLTMVTPKLRERSIEVHAELPAVLHVQCDADLIQRLVLNLLLNAYDALGEAPLEQRRIDIDVRAGAGVAHLVVADHGPGIAAEVLATLFQRPLTTRGGAHQGLGLVTSYAALRQVGGHIEGRNAPTGGAVFEVTLVAAPAGAPELVEPPRLPAPAVKEVRHVRILAVDDAFDIVDVIRDILEPLVHEVVTTTDPEQAIATALSQEFDLVLCDLGMPKRNGLEVCRALRAAGYRGKLVLMTGLDSHAMSRDLRAAGCDALLEKPFKGAELIDVIHLLLGP